MRNATSILLFGASSLVLSAVACGGGDGDANREMTAGTSSTAGTPGAGGTPGAVGTPGAAGSTPTTAGSSGAGTTGGAPACMPMAGPKNGGDGMTAVIDELDDANTMFAPGGSTASGTWDFSKDMSAGTIMPANTMGLMPVDGGQMGKALHVTGTGLVGWGAALAAILNGTTSSFDASAFDGVAFFIKGTSTVFEGENKVFVTARMAELLPGTGSCCKDPPPGMPNGIECYSSHFKVVDLTADWKEVKLVWADFGKRTWGLGSSTEFNPNRLRDIVFSFNHDGAATGGTPADGAKFDVWVDGLRFLKKGEMGNQGGGMGGSNAGGASAGGGAGGTAAGSAGGGMGGMGGTQ